MMPLISENTDNIYWNAWHIKVLMQKISDTNWNQDQTCGSVFLRIVMQKSLYSSQMCTIAIYVVEVYVKSACITKSSCQNRYISGCSTASIRLRRKSVWYILSPFARRRTRKYMRC